MTEKPKPKKKKGINPNLLIGILGVAATLIAGLIPVLFDSARAEPTLPPAPIFSPTVEFTPVSAPTRTFTPLPPAFTPTTEPPTSMPTPIIGIYNIKLAMDAEGKFPTTVFAPAQHVFVFYSINDPSGLRKVKIVWYAVEVADLTSNSSIFTSEKTVADPNPMVRARFPDQAWRIGKYRIDFFLNGVFDESVEFEVKQ